MDETMVVERTLVVVKPDCVERRLAGTIITGLECSGLRINKLQMRKLSRMEAENLYAEHQGKWHFERNIKHVTSGPVVLLEVEGDHAIKRCRDFVEQFRNAHRDVIRLPKNLIHATDNASKVPNELRAVGFSLAEEKLAIAV